MKRADLRRIPAVEKVLLAVGDADLPRSAVVAITRREIAALRRQKTIPDFDSVVARVLEALRALDATRIKPLINGTGIIVHTNFGRAPMGPGVVEHISRVASHYNNLEYGLTEGERGTRAAYLEHNLALLCGAEAATVVNNNAGALVLILRHFCATQATRDGKMRGAGRETRSLKNEVVISRGELVQIGGGFRIPDILEASGARLREIGTTNKTSLADYSRAISPRTAMILRVHRSNFYMSGFVESPSAKDIALLARKKRIPFIEDLGSGAMIETQAIPGLEHEPTPAEVLRSGADLVCFSGDKLMGGPQAGIIAGKAKIIASLKREFFFRALRCDKLVLSALEILVDGYLRWKEAASSKMNPTGDVRRAQRSSTLYPDIPVLAMLRVSNEELRLRAEKLVAALEGLPVKVTVGDGHSQVGGGTLPRSAIASVTLDLAHDLLKGHGIAARLRTRALPVIGYVAHGKFKIDLRTVFPHQDEELLAAVRALCGIAEMK